MTLTELRALRNHLDWLRADPDGKLTDAQRFHVAHAIKLAEAGIAREQAKINLVFQTIPSLAPVAGGTGGGR